MATKGLLRLGLVTVPVKAVPAINTSDSDTTFHIVCTGAGDSAHTPQPISLINRCPECGREGSRDAFPLRGQCAEGTWSVLSADDIADADPVPDDVKSTFTMTVYRAEDVERLTLPYGRYYDLAPKAAGPEYLLIRELLRRRRDLAFLTEWAPRSARAVFRLVARGDVLGLQELARPEQIRAMPELRTTTYDERMLPLLEQFADTLISDFDPHTFRDERRVKLAALLAAADRVAAAPTAVRRAAAATPDVNPLLTALQAAVDAAAAPEVTALSSIRPRSDAEPMPDNVTALDKRRGKRPRTA